MTQTNAPHPFEVRRDTALKLLKSTGIRTSNDLPPFVRFLWWLGFKVPSPHFAGFLATALATGVWFTLAWGTAMWLIIWRTQQLSMLASAVTAVVAGGLFGLAMAGYYAYGRRKHRLPAWKDLSRKME
ncbi:DUF6404 family protein [Rhodoferax sp.]|uniref:DUF6404 family protein n=1 Tax=Rhodoferax sp. TaxID=50421 RepID=UPI0025FFB673|nr:DUF6404 family protein [Rhodoferax sp.]